MPPKHYSQPFDGARNRPGAAFKAPDVARGGPIGPMVAESSAKPLRTEI